MKSKQQKPKSIRNRIMIPVLSICIIIALTMGITSVIFSYLNTMDTLEASMRSTADIAADRISSDLRYYSYIVTQLGKTPILSDSTASITDKEKVYDELQAKYGFTGGNIITMQGDTLLYNVAVNLAERAYFVQGVQGKCSISEPVLSKKTGTYINVFAAPLWANGIEGSEIVGVVFLESEDILSNIIRTIQIGENGFSYINNASGKNIAHTNSELVTNANNNIENAKTDASYAEVAAIEEKMILGEVGAARYDGVFTRKIVAYTPIAGSDNWSLAVVASGADFFDEMYACIRYIVILSVGIVVVTFSIIYRLSSKIATDIRHCAARLTSMAEGDMSGEPLTTRSRDELGVLVHSTNTIIHDLTGLIREIGDALNALSEGNLADASCSDFKRDFAQVSIALKQIIVSLNQTISQMSESSEHVASGADAISSAATSLSQGSLEQASAVEELHETISNISLRVKNSAEKAKDAKSSMVESGTELDQTHAQMEKMTEAMILISSKSTEISKIIKTIEDIAFQTNILALNAAVEASRAGDAGKGFAVVAEEVRNLATKSSEAAQSTSDLIEETLKAIKSGTGIATDTSKSLDMVVASAAKVNTLIQDISEAAVEESEALEQVSSGIAQISTVVMTNSSTAEESAAASETLTEQARLLSDMVHRFKLKEI